MNKIVWITFVVALVLVNLASWLVELFSGFHIFMMFRLAMVLGITVITSVFAGAMMLVNSMEKEQPLTRNEFRNKPPSQ